MLTKDAFKAIVGAYKVIRGLNNVAPVISRASFEQLQKSSQARMQGATWEPLQDSGRPSPPEFDTQMPISHFW